MINSNGCKMVAICSGEDCRYTDDYTTCKYSSLWEMNGMLLVTRCNNRQAIISACLDRAGKELEYGY